MCLVIHCIIMIDWFDIKENEWKLLKYEDNDLDIDDQKTE